MQLHSDLSNYITKEELSAMSFKSSYKLIKSGTVSVSSSQSVTGDVSGLAKYSEIYVISGGGNNFGEMVINVDAKLEGQYIDFKNLSTASVTSLSRDYSGGTRVYCPSTTATTYSRFKIENVGSESFVTILHPHTSFVFERSYYEYPNMPVVLHGTTSIDSVSFTYNNASSGLMYYWKVYGK